MNDAKLQIKSDCHALSSFFLAKKEKKMFNSGKCHIFAPNS